MRRVPDFLPPTIHVWTNPPKNGLGGAIAAGTHLNAKHPIVTLTLMNLMTYQSPALVHGLLMTEILEPENNDVHRYFFGYQCTTCQEVFLVPRQVRRRDEIEHWMGHPCDSSDLRRAVRNAREMGRERGEVIMEGIGGRWWTERPEAYRR